MKRPNAKSISSTVYNDGSTYDRLEAPPPGNVLGGFVALVLALLIVATFVMTLVMLVKENNEINDPDPDDGDDDRDDDWKRLKMCCFDPVCVDYEADECWVHVAVLGGGSSGSIVARKLSDTLSSGDRYSVLVLEQGQNYNSDFLIEEAVVNEVPYFLFPGSIGKYTKTFSAELMDQLPNYVNTISQGDMLGGTGSHDYCLDVEPSPMLGDLLQAATGSGIGDIQWDYATLKSVIDGYENYIGTSPCSRGVGGMIDVSQLIVDSPGHAGYMLADAIVANSPVDSSTVTHTDDYNCNSETSFTEHLQFFFTPEGGGNYTRSSPGLNYLDSTVLDFSSGFGLNERLLRVVTDAYVTRFVTNSAGRATKVEAIVNGKRKVIHVTRQIVVTMGSISTPGFFERSGYGDQTVLEAAGIPVLRNMPDVGEGLQQHYGSGVMLKITGRAISNLFFDTGMGLLAAIPDKDGLRAVQCYMTPGNLFFTKALANETNFIVACTVVAPDARGSVHITSPSPFNDPEVKFNAYEDEGGLDMAIMTNITMAIYQATVDLSISDSPNTYEVLYPPEDVLASGNLTLLETFIKELPLFQSHYSSTMQMNKVLNANLEFLGATGITVADCSAWPLINNGNSRTQAMITATQAASRLLTTMAPP